jgi:drug/metabolite transporter (DMT)-like permease
MNFGLGEFFSLASAAAWAVGVILYRRLGETLPPLALNFLKNLLVLGMVLPAAPLLHGFAVPSFTAWQAGLALGSGFVGIALADTLYFRALNELGASRMGIVGNLYSPLVIVLSFAFLGERLSAMQIGGFVLVTAGVLTIAMARAVPPLLQGESRREDVPHHRLQGFLLGVLSIALMACAIVMVKRVLEAQPLMWVTLLRLIGAVGGLFVIALFSGNLHRLRPNGARFDWRLLLAAAFVGQCLSMVLWLAGYKFTQASIAAILNETSSVWIVLLAWWWLKEPLGRRGAIGVTLTLGGVALMLR